ncbi:hypothetical protein FGO68_gene2961 [Halteria grandinella]|uniref:Uncharacterized protein n=1 Tax=Halteria grandinella TaxID=5974 RepID=A0A8J8NRK0_HALGN|nr:hypothetical protein FGO68_gene2961 [Halteria grandinella]
MVICKILQFIINMDIDQKNQVKLVSLFLCQLYFWIYLAIVLIWICRKRAQGSGGRTEWSTKISISGYLLVLGAQALTRTILAQQNQDHPVINEVFKSLEKFSARIVNLVLYFFVLELLPIKIILTQGLTVLQQQMLLKRQKIFSWGLMIIAAIVGLVLTLQRMYDYIAQEGTEQQAEWSCLLELIFSVLKFLIDLIVIYLFITVAIFYLRLKIRHQKDENGEPFTRKNYWIFALISFTLLMEVNYAIFYICHRFVKYFYYPDANHLEPYNSFRQIQSHIIDKTRNFTTGLALFYLFTHLSNSSKQYECATAQQDQCVDSAKTFQDLMSSSSGANEQQHANYEMIQNPTLYGDSSLDQKESLVRKHGTSRFGDKESFISSSSAREKIQQERKPSLQHFKNTIAKSQIRAFFFFNATQNDANQGRKSVNSSEDDMDSSLASGQQGSFLRKFLQK